MIEVLVVLKTGHATLVAMCAALVGSCGKRYSSYTFHYVIVGATWVDALDIDTKALLRDFDTTLSSLYLLFKVFHAVVRVLLPILKGNSAFLTLDITIIAALEVINHI